VASFGGEQGDTNLHETKHLDMLVGLGGDFLLTLMALEDTTSTRLESLHFWRRHNGVPNASCKSCGAWPQMLRKSLNLN
jgi:hypothetical protein